MLWIVVLMLNRYEMMMWVRPGQQLVLRRQLCRSLILRVVMVLKLVCDFSMFFYSEINGQYISTTITSQLNYFVWAHKMLYLFNI